MALKAFVSSSRRKLITDDQTGSVFLSDKLLKHSKFNDALTTTLSENQIPYAYLTNTQDIWCMDYMPIQKDEQTFIQFRYNPDYLKGDQWKPYKTDPLAVTQHLGIDTLHADLVFDGGNLIKGKDWIIVTDKVFVENPSRNRKTIVNELENLFEAKPIIIPRDPDDFTGHADGMVRYYNDNTVLINRYRANDKPAFQKRFKTALRKEGLHLIEVPYNPYRNADYDSAVGMYINYLQVKDLVVVPTFGLLEDELALRQFEDLFPFCDVVGLESRVIAVQGGVLNCITWNIHQPMTSGTIHFGFA